MTDAARRRGCVRAKVLAFLENDGGQGAPSGYISRCIGVPPPTVRRELSALLKAGRIHARQGEGAKVYYVEAGEGSRDV